MKLKDVMAMTSLGSSTIYRKMAVDQFPRPRELSPACVRWIESEIVQWIGALPVSKAA